MSNCSRCYRQGHLSKDCFSYKDANGEILPRRIEETDSEDDDDSDYLGSEEESEESKESEKDCTEYGCEYLYIKNLYP